MQTKHLMTLLAVTSIVTACPGNNNDDDDGTIVEDLRPPVINSFVDRKYQANRGLLTAIDGPNVDPQIEETHRFYDAIGIAPPTFEDWKLAFGFSPRMEGETLEAYRARTHTVVYYNKSELGLGRELGCAEFVDGVDDLGNAIMGVACFVTNYGGAFRDTHNSLRDAIDGVQPKNTVCITYRPTLGESYENQFYVYGGDGNRQDWAQLDTLGARPVPQVCVGCHGGHYDEENHLAKFARFLPMDPYMVTFSNDRPGATLADQQESIRVINELAMKSPLTEAQIRNFSAMYEGRIDQPGQLAIAGYAPEGWRDSQANIDFYDKVVKPYCLTCHLAEQNELDGSEHFAYRAFDSARAFAEAPMLSWVCGSFSMPNAQPTMLGMWNDEAEGVSIDGVAYPTAGDAFLAFYGADRATCSGLSEVVDCRRAEDPDWLCGNETSGAACDLGTGRCVPTLASSAPTDPSEPTGICKTDGSRGCPGYTRCISGSTGVEGYDGVCVK